ncbi:argininosuccinate lyase [Thermosulfidibacter takaii ABI70S6]|uniref:Argininosuccinate lyase n=1 Tax=Thermosulfidibacter takaii (strain DSM 17441 / JCM 13301 / NBRC 103674 / ABI70S6) TaxID=1298851 RepID=A0A0S3QU55_THET7|nr:argininosuccinate lyase [Thermosulfidibacter takaii]BAT71864.1 argininosuccinate lyase [Thermosulfidibacter takaii ABI70S6]
MGKLWGGRFKEKIDDFIEQYTESISYDSRLYKEDIRGSIAHCEMLVKQGIISQEEGNKIIEALKEIEREIDEKGVDADPSYEDIHTYIESKLREKISDLAGKLHTARSRNDQVVLDERLFLRKEIRFIEKLISDLQLALVKRAYEEVDTILPGFTHLQHAQPVSLGFHLLAYYEMLERDRTRFLDCLKRMNQCPLGSCALAGTTLPIDRFYVAEKLGFDGVTPNAMDTVSSRDFIVEFLAAASILMVNLSRFCEEMVLWSSSEFSFVELSDEVCTGSSIMPQKKNPDVAELTRGKTGRVIGDLIALLVTLKGLPLSYNRDLQEDKEPFFDAVDTVKGALKAVRIMVEGAKFNRERMREMALEGFTDATDVADYLVRKGVPFRKAHEIVGKMVVYCIEKGKRLGQLSLDEMRRFATEIDEDIYDYISLENIVDSRKSYGGTSRELVRRRLEEICRQRGWSL